MTLDPACLWLIEIRVPNMARRYFETALGPFCMSLTTMLADPDKTDGDWNIGGFRSTPPNKKSLRQAIARAAKYIALNPVPKPKFSLVTPKDWLAENLANFPPLKIGRYFIYGSHFDGIAPTCSITLQLNAGTAFGSGEHPSTTGCLIAIDWLARQYHIKRPLDMGCGSGILAIAMAKTWRAMVVACDLDDEAVRVTAANARLNNVKKLIQVRTGPSYQTPIVVRGRPYDLIAANILARPLKAMAGHLVATLAPGGIAILSGLLRRDSQIVIQAHRIRGLRLIRTILIGDWVTIVMKR
jgi:ribosomal protein L11 methyltransferase